MSRWPTASMLAIVALFSWFNAGANTFRHLDWGHLSKSHSAIIGMLRPWRLAQAYVSRDGDEHLYFEYSHLILGEPADLRYIASKRQGDTAANLSQLTELVSAKPGLRVPYRDFPLEYPPVPLLMMLAPRLIVDGLEGYRVAFGALTGLLYLSCAALAARLATLVRGGSSQVWKKMAWLALAIGPIICGRFDILPATLITLTLVALAYERVAWAALAMAFAALTKLYPFLLLIPMTAYLLGTGDRKRAILFSVGSVSIAALLSLPFLVVAPTSFLGSLFLYGARPLQVESILGTIVLAIRGRAAVVGSFGSLNVTTPVWLGRVADVLFLGAFIAVTVGAVWSGRRGRSFDGAARLRGLILWTCVTLAAILSFSKVMSPQFLLWLVPFPAVIHETRTWSIFRWTILSAALTQLYYPVLYGFLLDGNVVVVGIVLARNAVLILLAMHTGRIALRNFGEDRRMSRENGAAPR